MVAAMSLYKGMKEKSITQKIESEFWKVKRRIFFSCEALHCRFSCWWRCFWGSTTDLKVDRHIKCVWQNFYQKIFQAFLKKSAMKYFSLINFSSLQTFFIEKVRLSWKLHQGLFQGKITNAIGKLILTRLGQFLPKCINLISLLKLKIFNDLKMGMKWLFTLVPVVQFGFGCLWMDFLLSSIF